MKRHFWIKQIAVILVAVVMFTGPLYCGLTSFAAGTKIDSDELEDIFPSQQFVLGEPIDTTKTYEYLESTLFNEACQEVWDLAESSEGVEITAGQQVSGHNTVKISTDKDKTTRNMFQTYFWNNKSPGTNGSIGRIKNTNALFASTDVSQYEGIRIWVSKPKSNKYSNITLSLGSLHSKGDAPAGSDTKEFTYTLNLPDVAYEGYAYIPFDKFKNKNGDFLIPSLSYEKTVRISGQDVKIDQVRALSFIGFKYGYQDLKTSDIYFGELALYREGTGGVSNSGKLNMGVGVELDKDTEYVYADATGFNNSTDTIWAQAKNSGFSVKTGIKTADFRPDDAKSSIKLSTDGSSAYSQIYYWNEFVNESGSADRLSHGKLFGDDVDTTKYEGIRLWIKTADNNPYTIFTVILGKVYSGYYPVVPTESTVNAREENYYTYNLVVDGGFEGYVNIPFANFVDLLGSSLSADGINFIGFKCNDGFSTTTDFYVSNLQAYGDKEKVTEEEKGEQEEQEEPQVQWGEDESITYDYLESTLFNEAGQEIWDLSESSEGVTVTAGQQVSGHNAVKISTDKDNTSKNMFQTYFWNGKSPGTNGSIGRIKNTNALFASTDVSEYEGIRIWVSKPETNKYTKITLSLGSLNFKGDAPAGSDTKEFTCPLTFPNDAYEGYVYIPFESFKNKNGDLLIPSLRFKKTVRISGQEVELEQIRALSFIGFKYGYQDLKTSDIYFGELALYREGTGETDDSGKLNMGVGVKLDKGTEYVYADATDFNNSTDAIWAQAKNSGFSVKTGIKTADYRPEDAKSSIKLSTTGSTGSPQIYYWNEFVNESGVADRSSHGKLFGDDVDISKYEGVRLWVKTAENNPYTIFTVILGKMYSGFYPVVPAESMVNAREENYYTYTLVVDGGFEGYVNIPFANFVDLLGRSLYADGINFIGFKCNDSFATTTDFYVSNLQAYGDKEKVTKEEQEGSQVQWHQDEFVTYDYLESTVFNEAGQEIWDLAKISDGVTVTAGQEVSGHKVIKLSTDANGTSNYPQANFWNEKARHDEKNPDGREKDGRVKIDNLFASTDVTQYEGIRLWISKPEENKYTKINIGTGVLSKGGTPDYSDKEYFCSLALPTSACEGYVYIPFEMLKNKAGDTLLPTLASQKEIRENGQNIIVSQVRALNFISFKYSGKQTSDIYIGELALYREGEGKTTDTGAMNRGVGVELDENKEYMYLDALDFNNSTDEIWANSGSTSFTVTTGIKNSKYRPSDAKSSIKLSTTGLSSYPSLYYWREHKAEDGIKTLRSANGSLFGATTDLTKYEGVRLWVKADSETPYTTLSIMLGKMYSGDGYWPTVPKTDPVNAKEANFYTYHLVVYGGFEGYVNIPFACFVDLLGNSLPISDFNYIGFKCNDGYKAETDFYISNLMVYGEKQGEYTSEKIGVDLDATKEYEIVPSLVFNDSTQKLWNLSKIMGMDIKAGITDPEFIPKEGKTSVNLHTTGKKSSPDVYYWNEYSLSTGGRRTHSKFWGDVDCTEYEGIRIWIKKPADNTYSKLQIYLGQMYSGYWPNSEKGFYAYQINLPRGDYEGYINLPLSDFVNLKGEALEAKNLNFIAFKYNESGFKESDFYISDLSLYRVASAGTPIAPDAVIVPGKELQTTPVTKPDGTVVDDMGEEYVDTDSALQGDKNSDGENNDSNGGFNALWIVIPVSIILIAGAIFLFFFLKKRKSGNSRKE